LGIIIISQSQAFTVFAQAQPLRRLITPLLGVFAQAFFEKACVTPFSIKPFLKRFALRRLITPDRVWDKVLKFKR